MKNGWFLSVPLLSSAAMQGVVGQMCEDTQKLPSSLDREGSEKPPAAGSVEVCWDVKGGRADLEARAEKLIGVQ